MPYRTKRICQQPGCPNLVEPGTGAYCRQHKRTQKTKRYKDNRPSARQRGYDREWEQIRTEVLLKHGIPKARHKNYVVDHRPRYNAAVEPDHRKYKLVPMLKSEHSRKTAREDGGFGHEKKDNYEPNV
jgi:5-methylcytosine-specific restriction protein A